MKTVFLDWNLIPYAEAWQRQTEWFDNIVRAKVQGESYENRIVTVSYTHLDGYKRQVRHLCADVDGKYSELSGSRRSLWIGICPRSVDAAHTGFQRNIFGEEWL